MQIDMHMFGTYTIARAAGINDRTARTIAITSQFVDDSTDDGEVVISNNFGVLSTVTSHKSLNPLNTVKGDQWRVWLPFHFLPGNDPQNGSFYQRLLCRKNSAPAQFMLTNALDEKNRNLWPYLIGVTAHVFADTFSHHGFMGISYKLNKVCDIHLHNIKDSFKDELNKLSGLFAKEIAAVGHGAASIFPDIPFLDWQFKYESSEMGTNAIQRNNASDFLEAAQDLHCFFNRYAAISPDIADPSSVRKWDDIKSNVQKIINTVSENQNARCALWKKAINDGVFFNPTNFDKGIDYSPRLWDAIKLFKDTPSVKRDKVKEFPASKFLQAANYHRRYVLNQLLPELGLLAP
jgi:hypothetical protein